MKLGVLVECYEDGADHHVCSYLLGLLVPRVPLVINCMGSKKYLIEECVDAIEVLQKKGCDHFLIIWDEMPAWPDQHEKPCLVRDRNDILDKLTQAGIPAGTFDLICVRRSIESWLLADEDAVANVLRTTHEPKIPKRKNPDSLLNPKGVLLADFERNRGRYFVYDEARHPLDIIKNARRNKLRRSESYCRFEDTVLRL